MLLEIRDGNVSRNGEEILSHFDFTIRGTEKAAIVGRNGAGKTTLLDVLTGAASLDVNPKNPDSGMRTDRKLTIEMLSQQAVQHPERTVEETILGSAGLLPGEEHNRQSPENPEDAADTGYSALYSKERFDYEQRYDRMLTELGLSLEVKGKALGSFSGGEQTKIMLIGLLLAEPDILILDEPTNHLDLASTEWLENYLRRYPKAVIVVSHDRYFIDKMADVVWEVSHGKLTRYTGNYTQYRQQKTERIRKQAKEYEAQQAEIARLDALIEKFRHKPRKAAFARSRVKIIERMDRIPAPERDDAVIHTGDILPEKRGSRVVLECEHLQIGYGDAPVRMIDLRLIRGRKLGVFGPNGSGKSTFLKTITGQIPLVKGKLRIGENIEIGYYDQMTARLRSEKNVFDWFHDQFPSMQGKDVRTYLAGYLFTGADLGKKVTSLSGGEKARLALAAILERRPNLLVLDEPTNNMDIPAKETLESIFRDYKGTILFVSHDRYFLSHVADSLLLFEASGDDPGHKKEQGDPDNRDKVPAAVYYPFGYEHYAERKQRIAEGTEVSIERSAEDQRLIDGLRSVPKASHLPRELSTAAAAADWEFNLNREAREQAEAAFRAADEDAKVIPDQENDYLLWLETEEQRQEKREKTRAAWTKECIAWYDLWLEEHPQSG